MPDKVVKLSPATFKKKTKAYSEIYYKETSRFMNILPDTAVETFTHFSLAEVEALVGFFRREKELDVKAIRHFSWLAPLLPAFREKLEVRLF